MANIYVSDETKDLLERAVLLDKRTQDGEINFLCSERLNILEVIAAKKTENSSSEDRSAGCESTPGR